jgi:hypothetical protein
MAFVHAQDPRRAEGGTLAGGRPDGTGYQSQLIQYPVICAADVIDYRPTMGSRAPVTRERREVSCPDCRERLR